MSYNNSATIPQKAAYLWHDVSITLNQAATFNLTMGEVVQRGLAAFFIALDLARNNPL
jgi:hypothetical protein